MKKNVKKLFVVSMATFAIVFSVALHIGFTLNGDKRMSKLSLVNVDALATTFTFNNQEWNDETHHILGNEWKPVVIACSSTETSPSLSYSTGGSISILGSGCTWNGGSISIGGTVTSYNGLQVQCQGGNGNCVNGTSCYGIAVSGS